MSKVAAPVARLDRVHGTSATLDELYEQTRLLHLSITTEARRVRAAARRRNTPNGSCLAGFDQWPPRAPRSVGSFGSNARPATTLMPWKRSRGTFSLWHEIPASQQRRGSEDETPSLIFAPSSSAGFAFASSTDTVPVSSGDRPEPRTTRLESRGLPRNTTTCGRDNPGPDFAASGSMITVSIAELLARGVVIQPREAVAIAQELTAHFASGQSTTPLPCGPLSPDTVNLARDGSVSHIGADAEPGLAEVALFLHTMLGSGAKVPGALRYTVARALREVDAPPFDSLADFSRTLARFEPGDRRAAVRELLERDELTSLGSATAPIDSSPRRGVPPEVTVHVPPRARRWPAPQAPPAHDRRHVPSQVTALRRQLREADQRLFEQQVASRKTARIVKMPALSVVSAPLVT